ncbi:MAG: hypothetical protein OQK11_07470 [Thiovulaceae bacterium]|nr:hypothetical protein [Sulfurimonadaceae bacterium]
MKNNLFSLLFKKKSQKNKLIIPDSILLKKLKSVCKKNNYKVLENITLFHHSNKMDVPLMIIDPKRGIYIFEYKDWTYNDLTNYEIKKSHNNEQSKNTLAYEKINTFINLKFNEILHNDCVDIFNFLLTENLSFDDYEHLNEEKKNLLPHNKVIFCDNDEIDIQKKLNNSKDIDNSLPEVDFIIANLLTQYLVLDKKNIYFATNEQRAYIDDVFNYSESNTIMSLNGLASSGKTTTLILRAIYLKLLSEENSVTIIEPTKLSCDIVRQYILELIEYSIVNVDATTINVYTPEEFLSTKTTTHIFCDDTTLIEENLLQKIISKSAKSILTLVNPTYRYEHYYKLTKSFHKKIDIELIKRDPFKKAIELILDYSKNDIKKKVSCISCEKSREDLEKELKPLNNTEIVFIDGSKNLIDQTQGSVIISDYKNMSTLRSDIIILLDVCKIIQEELSYAINLANKKVYILYNEDCQSIITLKKIFNKE